MELINLEIYKKICSEIPTPLLLTSCEGNILYLNQAFTNLTGYKLDDVLHKKIGKQAGILYSGFHSDSFYKKMWDTIKSTKYFIGQLKNRKQNGDLYWQEVIIQSVLVEDSGQLKSCFLASITDITKTRHAKLTLSAILENISEEQLILIFESDNTLLEALGKRAEPFLDKIGQPLDTLDLYSHEIRKQLSSYFEQINKDSKKIIINTFTYGANDFELTCKRFNSSRFIIISKDITESRDFLKTKMGLHELEAQVERLIQSRPNN